MKIAIIIIIIIIIYLCTRRKSSELKTTNSQDNELSKNHSGKPKLIKSITISELEINNIELNDEIKNALNLIINKNESLYITGKAGTGKSTFLKYIRATSNKNIVVLAPTGVAAIIIGGQTIHSFFRFPPKLIKTQDIRQARDSVILNKLDTIIIDEVSMVRADLMDGIDYSLRLNRDKLNEPFGGVQMLFFGDLFQLPPVVNDKELQDYLNAVYGAPYFFYSNVFKDMNLRLIELKKIYRQTDKNFINILNKIRENKLDDHLLSSLNAMVIDSQVDYLHDEFITLTTTNKAASEINDSILNKINEKLFVFEGEVKGSFNTRECPTESKLKLKKGARVILLKNDPDKRWVNGTICNVSYVKGDRVFIDLNGQIYELIKYTWEKIEYYFDRKENKIEDKVIGSFTQFPLRLAWAITIHKSQGHTFSKVFIDLGSGAFAHGQTYVALSRCKSLEGIKLKRPLFSKDVIFDRRIYEYSKIFNKVV